MEDNSDYSNCLQLYSETGYLLKITPNGDIRGTDDWSDCYTHLKISTGGDVGLVRIQGMCTNLFVGFDCHGKLYSEEDPENEATIFKEEFQGSYTTYKSICFPEWYIGIKKNGLSKNGQKTAYGQKAIKFLPRRL